MAAPKLAAFFIRIAGGEKKTLHKGEVLFRAGEPARFLFSVATGQVRLVRYTTEGEAVTIHSAARGETFAEAALFSDVYHCHAIAMGPSVVHCHPKVAILAQLAGHADIAADFMRHLARQVRDLRTLLELHNVHAAPERVMQYLLLHADAESKTVSRTLSGKEIAQQLGLAHETLYRALARLEKEDKIKRTTAGITIRKFSLI